MYGPARTWTDAIRKFRGGKLLVLDPSKGVRDSLPAINDVRLPFANPPNPRENTRERRLLPVARFWSELTQSILWKTRGPFGPSDTIYPFLYLFSGIYLVKYIIMILSQILMQSAIIIQDLETPELWRTPFSCPLEYCGSGGIITGQRNTLRWKTFKRAIWKNMMSKYSTMLENGW